MSLARNDTKLVFRFILFTSVFIPVHTSFPSMPTGGHRQVLGLVPLSAQRHPKKTCNPSSLFPLCFFLVLYIAGISFPLRQGPAQISIQHSQQEEENPKGNRSKEAKLHTAGASAPNSARGGRRNKPPRGIPLQFFLAPFFLYEFQCMVEAFE